MFKLNLRYNKLNNPFILLLNLIIDEGINQLITESILDTQRGAPETRRTSPFEHSDEFFRCLASRRINNHTNNIKKMHTISYYIRLYLIDSVYLCTCI